MMEGESEGVSRRRALSSVISSRGKVLLMVSSRVTKVSVNRLGRDEVEGDDE